MAETAYNLIRTATMDWEPDPEIPGFKQQILRRDAKRKSVVRKWFVPPAFGDVLEGKPDRHYHKSVVERAYVLAGDFPHWEFPTAADFEGELFVFRRDLAMDRPPGSLHGLLPEPKSQVGSQILYWNTGPGTSIREKGFEKETINVAFDKKAKSDEREFTQCRLLQTNELPWQRHPRVTGLKWKPLMPAISGAGETSVVCVPADFWPVQKVSCEAQAGESAWLYVLSGDLKLRVDGTALTLGEGDYLEWRTPSVVSFGQGEASDGGATVVCTGHALG
jgi:hypothetical protein